MGVHPLRRAQTLADEYLIFNSDEHFAAPHGLVLENGIAAFSTNSVFTSSSWSLIVYVNDQVRLQASDASHPGKMVGGTGIEPVTLAV